MILLLKKILAHFVFQLICLGGIAFISRYQIPDLSETDWNSALFLTPLGMLRNFNDESPVMRSFYFDTSVGQVELSGWQTSLIFILLTIQIINFARLTRLLKMPRP